MKKITDPFKSLNEDKARIGKTTYQGEAYFWSCEYKHYLRGMDVPTSPNYWPEIMKMRQRIHAEFLAENLELNGSSEQHLDIVLKHWGCARTNLQPTPTHDEIPRDRLYDRFKSTTQQETDHA